MTDGAARLLQQHSKASRSSSSISLSPSFSHSFPISETPFNKQQPGVEHVFAEAYKKLVSRGGPDEVERWTSGQWMTERSGGSDVSNTETVAEYSPLTMEEMGELGMREGDSEGLGPWVINGYKFFSSAADANMTILLAKTDGSEGLSAFYAPLKRKVAMPQPRESEDSYEEGGEYSLDGGVGMEWNGVNIVRLKKKLLRLIVRYEITSKPICDSAKTR